MRTIFAYVVVVPLVQFCLTIGVFVGVTVFALLFAWAPVWLRTKVCGVCGGVAGVTLAVAFGYGVFRLLAGPGSFSLGPFLASTVPLLLPIGNDFLAARRVAASRERLLGTFGKGGPMDSATQTGHGSGVVGEVVGLLLVMAWFLGTAQVRGVEGSMSAFMLLFLMVSLYFAPTLIAFTRNHPRWMAIGVLNLIGSWTLIGWLIAFVWASGSSSHREANTGKDERAPNGENRLQGGIQDESTLG